MFKLLPLCSVLFAVIICNSSLFSADRKENVAVLDFKLINISNDTGNIVRNKIEYTLFDRKKFNLLERNRIELIRNELKLQNREDDNTGFAVEAGRLLPADYLVTGEIILKDKIYVNMVLVSAINGDIVYSFSREYKTEEDLLGDSENIAMKIEKEILYNGEFGKKKEKDSESLDYYLAIEAGYIPSAGKISEFAEKGFIYIINVGKKDIFLDGVEFGVHAAYSHLYTEKNMDYAMIAPLLGTLSYEYSIYRRFFINAGLGFGTALVSLEKEDGSMSEFEACGMLLIKLKYYLRPDLAFTFYGNYYTIFETDGNIDFYSSGIGIETLF